MGIVIRRLLFVALTLPMAAWAAAQLSNIPNVEYNPLLVMNAQVQKDLKLSPQGAAKIQNAFMEEAMKLLPVVTSGAPNSKPLTAEQRTQKTLAGIAKMQARIAGMLTPTQRVRLRQLTLQSIGPSAVLQPKVASALGLSATQKSKLLSAISASNARLAAQMKNGRSMSDWQQNMGQMTKLQNQAKAEGNKALMATLTASQKAKWKAMLGKPLPLSGFLGAGSMGGMFGAPGHRP